jgi:tRNA(fMet)-specific endonuclease VapC
MKYLLDTNTVSYYPRGDLQTVRHVQAQSPPSLSISAITAMELVYGIERRRSGKLTTAVMGFLSGIQVFPFDREAAQRAGSVRAALGRIGAALSVADCRIAGHALTLKLTLVSTDAAFRRVLGLVVKNWLKP